MAVDEATTRFLREPQPAEVFHSGVWHPGTLLGWRHDTEGRCWVRVRCVVGGLRHTAWTDLASVRLPETAAEDAGAAAVPARRPDDAARAGHARQAAPAEQGVPWPRGAEPVGLVSSV
ncbi:MAG TPA: hypothetical protein VHF92_18245 [Geodermatophilus sp.]|nr:hypothetical protein [Geodermatophilus sp.]